MLIDGIGSGRSWWNIDDRMDELTAAKLHSLVIERNQVDGQRVASASVLTATATCGYYPLGPFGTHLQNY